MRHKTSKWTKFHWLVLPQILLTCVLVTYLLCGAVIFRKLDEELDKKTLYELIVFEVSTLATIGYGDIAPRSTAARAFCIAFSIIGIPLFLLSVANISKYISKAYWLLASKIMRKKHWHALRGDSQLPIWVSGLCFVLYVIFGAWAIRHSGNNEDIVDDVYFSFISFSTVGYGDRLPIFSSFWQFLFTTGYLTLGIVLLSAIFTSLSMYLRKLHYIGRRFRGAKDVQVWMGGRSMPVSKLLTIVGTEFDASPRQIREVLRDLDCLIVSVMEKERQEQELKDRFVDSLTAPIVKDIEDFDDYELCTDD